MKITELRHFEKLLRDKRKSIVEKIKLLDETFEESSSNVGVEENTHPYHMAELGTDESSKESLSIVLDNLVETLREIDLALTKINEGTFGICENCGKRISRERLEAIPYARYCKECSEQMEAS